jgi:lysozyme
MRVSDEGIKLIKHFEGYRETPYKCSAGYYTVGYGHLITRDSVLPSSWNRTFSSGEIDDLLRADLQRFELGVLRLLRPMQPTQSVFDSVVSFSFNLGLGTFQRSSVRSALIRGDKKRAGKFF